MKKPRNSQLVIAVVLLFIVAALLILGTLKNIKAQTRSSEVHIVRLYPNAYTVSRQVYIDWISAYPTVCIFKQANDAFYGCFEAPVTALAVPFKPIDVGYMLHTGDVLRFEFRISDKQSASEVLYAQVPEAVFTQRLPILVNH